MELNYIVFRIPDFGNIIDLFFGNILVSNKHQYLIARIIDFLNSSSTSRLSYLGVSSESIFYQKLRSIKVLKRIVLLRNGLMHAIFHGISDLYIHIYSILNIFFLILYQCPAHSSCRISCKLSAQHQAFKLKSQQCFLTRHVLLLRFCLQILVSLLQFGYQSTENCIRKLFLFAMISSDVLISNLTFQNRFLEIVL